MDSKELLIYEDSMVKIGGVKQHILVRGNNYNKPILLFLHGGPGGALSFVSHMLPKEYEDNFIIAHWDQRGSGKSYSNLIPTETMNLDQLVADTIEVTKYLINKYNKEKIYLLGLSFGTALGILAIKKAPSYYYAYFGTGQVVNTKKAEKVACRFLLNKANEFKDEDGIKELSSLTYENFLSDWSKRLKWTRKYDYAERHTMEYFGAIDKNDLNLLIQGIGFSEIMIPELVDINFELYTHFNVPIIFILGEDDYQTPIEPVSEFYENICAPYKHLEVIKNAAHDTIFYDPLLFLQIMINQIDKIIR